MKYASHLIICMMFLLPACRSGQDVDVTWNHDPAQRVIAATYCCEGPQLASTFENYIPKVQIWGDGRILRVESQEADRRRLLEGQLDEQAMQDLLERAVEAGFFSWQDRYADEEVVDGADKCITIDLVDRSKTVCEYHRGAPQAFGELHDFLMEGAGIAEEASREYRPESGFLTTSPLDETATAGQRRAAAWPDGTGLSLAEATGGMWIEGEALQQVWQIVNDAPWNALAREDERYYHLTIQVPGASPNIPADP